MTMTTGAGVDVLTHNQRMLLNALLQTTTSATLWAGHSNVVTTNLTDFATNNVTNTSNVGIVNAAELYYFGNSSPRDDVTLFDSADLSGGKVHISGRADDVAVLRWLQYLLVPTIVLLGVAANSLALLVYSVSRLRFMNCSIYLGALAATDSGFLLCLLDRWAHSIWWNTWEMCPVNYYFTGVFSFLSMAYVLCYTVERYIATCWPLHRKTWCTRRRAIGVVITSLVFALVIFSPTLLMFEMRTLKQGREMQCEARHDYKTMLKWASICHMCFFWLIPMGLTIFFNTCIIRKIGQHDSSVRMHCSSHNTRRGGSRGIRLSSTRFSTGSTYALPTEKSLSVNSVSKPSTNLRRSSYRITRMLVLSSSAFIVLGLPYEVLKEYHYFSFDNWSLDNIIDQDCSLTYKVIVLFVYHIYYLNFGVDFFIYNLAGRNFRACCCEMMHDIGGALAGVLTCKGKAMKIPVCV